MNELIVLVILVLNVFLIFSALNRQVVFPYIFIFISVVSNILLSPVTESLPGVAFLSRAIFFSSLALYIYKANIKIDFIIKNLIFYFVILVVLYHDRNSFAAMVNYLSIFLFFSIGNSIKRDLHFYEMLTKTCKVLIIFFAIYLIFSKATGFGHDMYGGFTVGGLSNERIAIISFVSISLFGALFIRGSLNTYEYLYVFIALIILLLLAKRLGILLFFTGLSIYVLQSKIDIRKLGIFIIIAIGFMLLTTQYFLPKIEERLATRGRKVEIKFETLQRESRYKEYQHVLDYLKDNRLSIVLFGNGFGPTHNYRYTYLGYANRSIHTGFMYTLYTIGLFGTAIIILFSIRLIYVFFISSIRYRMNKEKYFTSTVLFGLPSICMFILSYAVENMFKNFSLFIIFFVLGVAYRGCDNNTIRHSAEIEDGRKQYE